MTPVAVRVAALVMIAGVVVGCSSDATPSSESSTSAAPPRRSLDGVYALAVGPYQAYVGDKSQPVDTYTAAFRSACTGKGCVATQSAVGDDNKPLEGAPARILDFVDGSWRWAGEVDGTCGQDDSEEMLAGTFFKAMSLTPQPDGTLTGTLVTLGGMEPCQVANYAPVTATRLADVETGVALPDPAAVPAPTASLAQALHGTYDYHYTDRKFAQDMPVTRATVTTYCLRTGTKCASLLLRLDDQGMPANSQVLTYADEHWRQTTEGGEEACEPPLEGVDTRTVITDFPLPKPPTDPITTLIGVETTAWVGPCPEEHPNDVVLTRIGD
jgi:serine/threonine-protein kinase